MFLLLIIMHSLELLYLLQLNLFSNGDIFHLLQFSYYGWWKSLELKVRSSIKNVYFGSWWIPLYFILPFCVCRRPVHEKVILNLIICNFFHYCFITSSTNMLGKRMKCRYIYFFLRIRRTFLSVQTNSSNNYSKWWI